MSANVIASRSLLVFKIISLSSESWDISGETCHSAKLDAKNGKVGLDTSEKMQ